MDGGAYRGPCKNKPSLCCQRKAPFDLKFHFLFHPEPHQGLASSPSSQLSGVPGRRDPRRVWPHPSWGSPKSL